MALGPASPQASTNVPPQEQHSRAEPPPFSSYMRQHDPDILSIRQQMFPLILTTYGIQPGSERAKSLALLLSLSDWTPQPPPAPPRIAYYPWECTPSTRSPPLLNSPPVPFRNIPDDVLSHILSFEAVPKALICQWHNVSQQWRRCLTQPLLGYYDFLRLFKQSCARQPREASRFHRATGEVASSPSVLVPRLYNVNVAVMRCMKCERVGVVEQNSCGTMWGHCIQCGNYGQFDLVADLPDLLSYFPPFIKAQQQAQEAAQSSPAP